MNAQQREWVVEAEEVSLEVEVAEQFRPFDLAAAEREEGFLWMALCSEWADYQEWREEQTLAGEVEPEPEWKKVVKGVQSQQIAKRGW